jgi:hypothetical protein
MLCDEIIQDKLLKLGFNNFAPTLQAITTAQKFVLCPDFAAAADGLVDNYRELERIAPFCRLPYANTWIEFAQSDRPQFNSAAMYYPQWQSAPARVGFLLQAQDATMARFRAHLLWTLREPLPKGSISSANASLIAMDYDITKMQKDLGDIVQLQLADFGSETIALLQRTNTLQDFGELARSDWAGEVRYLIAVLGLLNARNVASHEFVDKTQHNIKRIKARQTPLASHTLLKIRTMHKPVQRRGKQIDERAETRAHFVIGHFKARRTGLFFWGPHMRGRLGAGFKGKDYQVDK